MDRPGWLDAGFALLVGVAWPLFAITQRWPHFVAAAEAGVPNVRLATYGTTMLTQWALVGVLALIWRHRRRDRLTLGLVPPAGARLWVSVGLVLAAAAFAIAQNVVVRSMPAAAESVRAQLGHTQALLPHNPRELAAFVALSMTAGICEEVLHRGFIVWLLRTYVGLPTAIVLAAVVFGAAHLYQGPMGFVKAGVVALIMSGVLVGTRSLLPCMLLHAIQDAGAGFATYAALTGR